MSNIDEEGVVAQRELDEFQKEMEREGSMKEAIQKVDKAKTKEQSKESMDALRLAHDKLQVYPNLRPRLCRLRHVFLELA